MIYLDNAATTLRKPASVTRSVCAALHSCANPGRGGHAAAMRAAETVYRGRELAGRLFHAAPEQVVFTMNATHALNLAIGTLVGRGDRVVISGFEHNAVVRPLHARGAETVIASRALFDADRTAEDFSAALTPHTAAVIVNHVSNVFGYVQPVERIADLCVKRGIPLIVDASQSAGAETVDLQRLQAAFVAMPGHKGLYGPQGTGILLCGQLPKPMICGGTGSLSELPDMPDFLPDLAEAGTLNVHGIAGLCAGMEYVLTLGTRRIRAHERRLLSRLCCGLRGLEGVAVYQGEEQAGVVSFTVKDRDCEELAAQYAARGVALRAGLHCAPLAHASAGTKESGTLRVSLSAFTTAEEIEAFLRITKEIFKKSRS